jgi:hypothetical protein
LAFDDFIENIFTAERRGCKELNDADILLFHRRIVKRYLPLCHSCVDRNPTLDMAWIPVCTGMTNLEVNFHLSAS